jgi:predicted nucleotidyltransferase component of viral defense system
MNKDSLAARARKLQKEQGIPAATVYSRFFFDAFLARLVQSPYRDKFVLKGGLLLSSIFGVSERSTVDLDFLLTQQSMEQAGLERIMNEITSISIPDDGIHFRYLGSEPIREDDLYGGFSFHFDGCLSNIRVPFSIDVATGDPVIPSIRNYDYHCLVSAQVLSIKAYPLETVIAEKAETVISRGVLNSRSKDFYDLWLLRRSSPLAFDPQVLKKAYQETCRYRGLAKSKEETLSIIKAIQQSPTLEKRWNAYARKRDYGKEIDWKTVTQVLEAWFSLLLS